MRIPTKIMLAVMGLSMLAVLTAHLISPAAIAEDSNIDNLKTEHLVIKGRDGKQHSFNIEVAATPVDLEIGLMYRKNLALGSGMLFEMGKEQVTKFWMKNTLIPLDMLFIGADGEIKTIHENAEPLSLTSVSSEVPVTAVLELQGGRVHALGIHKGDTVVHGYFAKQD